jgi:sugar lactone lactonase YvrE
MRLSRLLLGILLLSTTASAEIRLINRAEGLDAPESAFYDEQSQLVFVSSMGNSAIAGPGGDAIMRNGGGSISVLQGTGPNNGLLLEGFKDWVKGLNAPKGVAVFQGRIVVAETNLIRVIEFPPQGFVSNRGQAARPRDSFPLAIPGAQLLNDVVVVPPGIVYVTDTFGNRIYRINGLFMNHAVGRPPALAKVEEFVSGPHLLSPNGITWDGGKYLWVVGTDTFTGYGNFTSPVQLPSGEVLAPANPEMPMPRVHQAVSPNLLPNLKRMFATDPKLAEEAADPMNPVPIPDPKWGLMRPINPVNSFRRPHHGKVYSVDLETGAVTILPNPDGGFDGVAMLPNGEGVLVGDFGGGFLMSVRPSTRFRPAPQPVLTVEHANVCKDPGFCSNPADFSLQIERTAAGQRVKYIYVPNITGNEVQTYQVD